MLAGTVWDHTPYKRRNKLIWWEGQLSLETLRDLQGCLPKVEKQLQWLQQQGRTGKTVSNYAEALQAFCEWCSHKSRKYLAENPLEGLGNFDTTPETERRALTADEIKRLLKVAKRWRRMLYEVAFCSGLRRQELMALTVDHLEVANCGLRLDAAWTKGRREDFQPLPKRLVGSLTQFINAGTAKQLYNRFYDGRTESQWTELPENPLLYVPTQAARTLYVDLKAAEIPKVTKEGKVDFHACRTAYVTHILGQGATVKEAQALARHKTPNLTMNVYGRTQQPRLTKLVEGLADEIFENEQDADRDGQPTVVDEQLSSTIQAQREKGDVLSHPSQTSYKVRARGVEPPPSCEDRNLNPARLPIPPRPRDSFL